MKKLRKALQKRAREAVSTARETLKEVAHVLAMCCFLLCFTLVIVPIGVISILADWGSWIHERFKISRSSEKQDKKEEPTRRGLHGLISKQACPNQSTARAFELNFFRALLRQPGDPDREHPDELMLGQLIRGTLEGWQAQVLNFHLLECLDCMERWAYSSTVVQRGRNPNDRSR